MEYAEILKLYGPLALGWVIAAYLGKFILQRYDADIEAKTKLALALQSLAETVKGRSNA